MPSRHLSPEEVKRQKDRRFDFVRRPLGGRVVLVPGGVGMQYSGDIIYAVVPESGGADPARRALDAALGMLQRLEALNDRRAARRETAIAIGIGLHTGPVVAGSIGSPNLLQYSYVGDTVNTASRIERRTRALDRALLVSGTTFERAGGPSAFAAERFPDEPIAGKREPLALWAVSARR
jgi:adenylate cyclase